MAERARSRARPAAPVRLRRRGVQRADPDARPRRHRSARAAEPRARLRRASHLARNCVAAAARGLCCGSVRRDSRCSPPLSGDRRAAGRPRVFLCDRRAGDVFALQGAVDAVVLPAGRCGRQRRAFMSEPSVSVVVAAVNSPRTLRGWLERIAPEMTTRVEVLVAAGGDDAEARSIAASFPFATLVTVPGAPLTPHLWGAAIARARGDVVAVTI